MRGQNYLRLVYIKKRAENFKQSHRIENGEQFQ